jgi:hypothetical protein
MIWRIIAWIVSRPLLANWLILRAHRTPYSHIESLDGTSVYMRRGWLFNPYFFTPGLRRFSFCPISIRVHHILRADQDMHLHDHPWNARTIVLIGGYIEERDDGTVAIRTQGSTAPLRYGRFHRIAAVDETQGAVTLFITGRKQGTWGFKIPYREYLAERGG